MASSEQEHRRWRGCDRRRDCEDSANSDRKYRQPSRFILYAFFYNIFYVIIFFFLILLSYLCCSVNPRRPWWRGFDAGVERAGKDRWWLRQARDSIRENWRREGGQRFRDQFTSGDRVFRKTNPESLRWWVGGWNNWGNRHG